MIEYDENGKVIIKESNMVFGAYFPENVIDIENSNIYKKLQQSTKIVEFILKRKKNIIFIEAKSSSPKDSVSEYTDKIADKFRNSLEVFMSTNLGFINDRNEEIVGFIPLEDIHSYNLKFYLVVYNTDMNHLKVINDSLNRTLISQRKIWNIEIIVINDEIAKKRKLAL